MCKATVHFRVKTDLNAKFSLNGFISYMFCLKKIWKKIMMCILTVLTNLQSLLKTMDLKKNKNVCVPSATEPKQYEG